MSRRRILWALLAVCLLLCICVSSGRITYVDVNSGLVLVSWKIAYVQVFEEIRIETLSRIWCECDPEACQTAALRTVDFRTLFIHGVGPGSYGGVTVLGEVLELDRSLSNDERCRVMKRFFLILRDSPPSFDELCFARDIEYAHFNGILKQKVINDDHFREIGRITEGTSRCAH
jgi:hypothetical protein